MSLYYLINIVKIEVLIFNFFSKNALCPFNTRTSTRDISIRI